MILKLPAIIYVNTLLNATLNNTSPYYLLAIMKVESNFRWNAIGDNGESFGLMQLHLRGAGSGHTPEELLDISNNIRIGSAYFRGCLDATGNVVEDAYSAYNQGIYGWRQRGRSINQYYVDLCVNAYEELIRATIEIIPDVGGIWEVIIEE